MSGIAVNPKLKEHYDSYYQGESEWRALCAQSKAQNIVRLCSSIPHGKILDIGCGEGAVLKRLSDFNFGQEFHSVEISRSAATAVLQRKIPRVQECKLFDGYSIPYESNQFDLAILSHVLEHVEYPRKLLYEASRVADYVFVEVPMEDTLALRPDFVFDSTGHINFYSPKTVRRLVQTCNLRVLSQSVTNPPRAMYSYEAGNKGILKYFIKQLALGASKAVACGFFTYHCSIVCTKASD
jgi:SAM-dependent methyltransferase